MNNEKLYIFLPYDSDKNTFSISEYNTKKNAKLKSELNKIKYDNLDELYSLLEQIKQNKKVKISLKSIKETIKSTIYDIKGRLYNYNISFSSISKYTELFPVGLKYDIKFELYKITNNINNNKLLLFENNKYSIILSHINEETINFLKNNFLNYNRPVLLFTNLEASLELNYSKGIIDIIFRNTYKTKLYMEINKIKDIEKSKKNFLSSGIYIDYLKSNEFSYIDWISTEQLFFGKNNKSKIKTIKHYNFEIVFDVKEYLEIETDSLYVENIKDEFNHYNSIKKYNINIYCIVKNIVEDKRNKIINVTLENLFDLNYIILEIPKGDKILNNLYINCIYIFINLIIFIDEKMNIKFTLQSNKNEKSEKIFLYFLIDPEKYYNKKLNDFIINEQFSQLLVLVTQNKLIRKIQKYFVTIDKIIYINLYLNESKEISYYNGLLHCSDGTSSALLRIKGNNILELKKLQIIQNINLYNKLNNENKITISHFEDINIQLIIIGIPIMENIKELSIIDIYENIEILKKQNHMNNLINFDLLLTKNEFTNLNGVFSKYSSQLEAIPMIEVINIFPLEKYINLIELKKNIDERI